MPLLAGFLGTIFQALFSLFAKRLALGFAAAAAFVSTSAAAYAAVKVSIAAIAWAGNSYLPPVIMQLFQVFLPTHTAAYVSAVLLADTVITSYDYFRNVLPVAFQVARG